MLLWSSRCLSVVIPDDALRASVRDPGTPASKIIVCVAQSAPGVMGPGSRAAREGRARRSAGASGAGMTTERQPHASYPRGVQDHLADAGAGGDELVRLRGLRQRQ